MKKHLYITIDTEVDADIHWKKKWPPCYSSVLEGIPQLLRPIWDKYDVHPVYFVSPEIVYDEECCKVLKEEAGKGAIIGAHLHGEYIEPDSRWGKEMGNVPFPCFEYDTDTERQKIINLTNLIEEKIGVRPVWYRAARFGADIDTIGILRELGYKYDSSVTPNINWGSKGGPDHSVSGITPYIISGDYYKGEKVIDINNNSDGIIELPVTILGRRWGLLGKILPDNWLFYRWLRPTHMTYLEMKHIINRLLARNNLVMMFHSMEIMVGKTPYVRWKWMQKYYLFRLRKIIEYAVKKGFNC